MPVTGSALRNRDSSSVVCELGVGGADGLGSWTYHPRLTAHRPLVLLLLRCSHSQIQKCSHNWGWYRPGRARSRGRGSIWGRSWAGWSWKGSPGLLWIVVLLAKLFRNVLLSR